MTEDRIVVGWDTETHRISPGNVHPPVVCLQTCIEQEQAEVVSVCESSFRPTADALFNLEDDCTRVAHSLSFDVGVMARYDDEYLPAIFQMLEDGRLTCTKIREKLLNLTSHGNLEYYTVGGTTTKIKYGLSDLVMQYFGVDITEDKSSLKRNAKTGEMEVQGVEDSWRLNYSVLEDTPVSEWPQEAVDYAASDAVWARAVYYAQEDARQNIIENAGHDPFAVLEFRCAVDCALSLMSARGVKTDKERVERVEAEIAEELHPGRLENLMDAGILKPEEPPRPYANGAKDHAEDCTDRSNCDCPPKMTKGKKESVDKTKLVAHVENISKENPDIEVKRTAPTDNFPEGQVSVDKDWLEDYAHLDPVLDEYKFRQTFQKMLTTEIPRMKWEGEVAPVVYPNFDSLKATGRTSSFAGDLYPSFNCQNVDPRMRRGYVPRPGHWMFSIDYGAMELGTFAQACINLFGYSHLAEIINSGRDPHAYLGAQIAMSTDEDFRELACAEVNPEDYDEVYELFMSLRDHKETKDIFKHFRTFAKPTGLGYPGGLGADTFIKYAKGTYGIQVDREKAVLLKEVWKQTFPEAQLFFDHVQHGCLDNLNGPRTVTVQKQDDQGEWYEETIEKERFRYESPMGMWRMACDYCACCNGMALQTPSAEGALLGTYEVVKDSMTKTSSIYGKVFPLMFIHDEIVGEIVQDTPEAMTNLLSGVAGTMVESMQAVTPDVRAKAEPVIMTRWDKFVDPEYDNEGFLVPTDPDKEN